MILRMGSWGISRRVARRILCLAAMGWSVPMISQGPDPNGSWSGQIQCAITVTGPGYLHNEMQTWSLAGQPALQGPLQVVPATWSTSGQGSLQATQGGQTQQSQWNTSAHQAYAPIGIGPGSAANRLTILLSHVPLQSSGGVTGTQQVGTGTPAAKKTSISLPALEFRFSAMDATNGPTVRGGSTVGAAGFAGPLQPAGSQSTANCSWQLTKSLPSTGNGAPAGGSAGTPQANPTPMPVKKPMNAPVYSALTPAVIAARSVPPTDRGNHTFNFPLQLDRVRGDASSDVDNMNAAWFADTGSDFYKFHLQRTVLSLAPPQLSAVVTISGLQSDADFDVRFYSAQSNGQNPMFGGPITHKGSAPLTFCLSNYNMTNGPDVVIELAARKKGPYQLKISGHTFAPGCLQEPIPTNNNQ